MQPLSRQALRWAKRLRATFYLRDAHWSNALARFNVNPGRMRYDRGTRSLFLQEFGITLLRGRHEFFLAAFHLAKPLKDFANAHFSVSEEQEIICEVGGIKVVVHTSQDVLILHEVYVVGLYNFVSASPTVFWDIGMNIGIASLFFASRGDAIVLGYEPFPRTFQLATANLALNPRLQERILTFNYGISDKSETMRAPYAEDSKESVSTTMLDRIPTMARHWELEEVTLRDVREIVDWTREQYPSLPIVVKLDCEGAEYNIIRALYESDKLSALDAIMIEWHARGPQELVEFLVSRGFSCFAFGPSTEYTGMLYAVKRFPHREG